MKLNDLCIGDGVIEEYKFNENTLVLLFKDFQGSQYNLCFNNCTDIVEKGSVGFSLCKALNESNQWIVHDDDGQVLSISYESVDVLKVN